MLSWLGEPIRFSLTVFRADQHRVESNPMWTACVKDRVAEIVSGVVSIEADRISCMCPKINADCLRTKKMHKSTQRRLLAYTC